MMNLILKKTCGFLLILLSVISFAQTVPPPPENPEAGDVGAPASPVDAYTLALFLVAVGIIIFAMMKQKQRIVN